MTRFKELKRIEAAIEHKDHVELEWAIGYCKMRLRIAGKKYWRQMERKVTKALDTIQIGSR